MNSSEAVINFADNTKNVCSILIFSLFLVILFVLMPVNLGRFFTSIGKCVIIAILGYIIYIQFNETNLYLSNTQDIIQGNPSLDGAKSSMILSYIFIVCILVLLIYIFKTLFD